MIRDGFQTSITGRAVEKGLLSLDTVNIRDFSVNKHNRVDDYPYGGGAGMVMQNRFIWLISRLRKSSRRSRRSCI